MPSSNLHHYLPAIQSLSVEKPLTKSDLLSKEFLMEKNKSIEMYYSPHNEYINSEAKIVIVGITPGFHQMKLAFEQVIKGLHDGQKLNLLMKEAKLAASFGGTMRNNLVEMMDQCGIPEIIGSETALHLFHEKRGLLHTTSVIKYPVFHHKKNYTGHSPRIDHHALLSDYAYREFPEELSQIEQPALIVPLGKTVEAVIRKLLREKKLQKHTFLFGFPHPSGANGHRRKQFQQEKKNLLSIVQHWTPT